MIWVLLASPSDFVKPALRVAVIAATCVCDIKLRSNICTSYAIVNLWLSSHPTYLHHSYLWCRVFECFQCWLRFAPGCVQLYFANQCRALFHCFVFKFSGSLLAVPSAYGLAFVSPYLSVNSESSSTNLSPVISNFFINDIFLWVELRFFRRFHCVVKLFVRCVLKLVHNSCLSRSVMFDFLL